MQVTIYSIGNLRADLRKWLSLSDEEAHREGLAEPIAIPVQNVLITLPGTVILVDAGRYEPSDPEFRLPDYAPPPSLLEQMGARAETVEHVVLTHAHFDHYLGVAHEGRPSFPRARYYLGKADLELARQRQGYEDSIGVLEAAGVLELVEGERELGHGATILPAPGETAGHQILRMPGLYCVGDLYHHEIEFRQPHLRAFWADELTNTASRQRLAAEAGNALIIPAHVAPGRYFE